ncbi:MAG: InlB B-repeat-containing protein [Lachnospiraceae bacterium]|nr:InlB B-repeat-containing protein [Lachnospiraceae bacterium]
MKKNFCRLLTILLLISVVAFCFSGCTNQKYTVTFMSYVSKPTLHISGRIEYDTYLTKQVEEGAIIGDVEVEDTMEIGGTTYKFCGWFTDKSYGIQWNLMSDTVKGDITLYSKWEAL